MRVDMGEGVRGGMRVDMGEGVRGYMRGGKRG